LSRVNVRWVDIIIYYINVGIVPSAEVPKYIEEVKNNMKAKETTDDGALQFFIPIKDKETEIKVFNLLDKELIPSKIDHKSVMEIINSSY